MIFRTGQVVAMAELAASLSLEGGNQFVVEAVIPGGMGECLKIRHKESGNVYALKVIKAAALSRTEKYARFLEEIRLWSTASACEGVAQMFAVARVNEIPCVCAEWMEGGNLRPLVGRRDVSLFYSTIDRVIGTLEWVYEIHAVIHRDLKPENLLLDRDGLVFVADWGIGKALQFGEPASEVPGETRRDLIGKELTQTGQFIGTVVYSAPEQILGSRSIDCRADIYSLGCLMYEWETGRPPFLGHSVEGIARQHLERPAPKLGGFFRRTTFGVEEVVQRCLAKAPDDRYASYDDLRNALQRCAKAKGVATSSFKPTSRYRIPLVGADEVKKSGFQGATLGKRLEPRAQPDGLTIGRYALIDFSEVKPFLKEAAILIGVGDWKRAAEVYARVFVPEMCRSLPDEPLYQQIAVNYAMCLTKLGRPDHALGVLDSISSSKSRPAEFFVNRSLAFLHSGRGKEAAECAIEGLRTFPDDPDLLGNLTEALTSQGKDQDALPSAQRRLSIERNLHSVSELAGVYLGLGSAMLDKNWPDAAAHLRRAIEYYTEAKGLNPRYLVSRFNLALAWFRLGEYPSASKELAEIAELPLDKSWGELWAIRQAECLNRVALFKECVEFCDKWLGQFPNSIGLQRVRAETVVDGFCIGHEKNGVRIVEESSLSFFTKVVEDDASRRASDFEYLARLNAWMGNVSTAFEFLDKAERLEPERWQVPFNRGAFYSWHLEDPKSALQYAQRACVRAPWNPQPWRLISNVQRDCGLPKDAEESRRRAESISKLRSELARAQGES